MRCDFLRWTVALMSILLFFVSTNGQHANAIDLQLTLPTEFYAVADREMSVYFGNVILSEHPENYRYEVECDLGTAELARWKVVPDADQAGRHRFSLNVTDLEGNILATASSTLIVSPAAVGEKHKIQLLLVGDSLTHSSRYPNKLARLLRAPKNPMFTMLGTHKPTEEFPDVVQVDPGVAHEGYGGWTWQRFLEHYELDSDGTHYTRSSPFVFIDDEGSPSLNLPKYFSENCNGAAT